MIIRSTADAGLCCYQVTEIQLLEGTLIPDSSPVIFRQLHKACVMAQCGRARWDGYTMLSFTLFLLCCVMCWMKKTGDESALLQDSFPGAVFTWKSFEFLSSFLPNNSGFTLLLETRLIKDEMAFLMHNRMTIWQ